MKLVIKNIINGITILLVTLQLIRMQVSAERLRDKIYTSILGSSCFRRLNGTHQVGCSSAQGASVGVLHLITSTQDIEFLVNNPPAPPYAPIIPPELFTRENVLRLKHLGGANISVIVIIDKTEGMAHFSHELQCPNQFSSITFPNSSEPATCSMSASPADTWNPWGTGLLYEDLPFPIYFVDDVDEISKLIDCFHKFNDYDYNQQPYRSLCAIEVNAFMSAAVNTEVCIRRTNFINNLGRTRYCDPLEGKNIYGTLFPRTNSDPISLEEKFILITCRMDTTSMFDGLVVGAMDSLTAYAILVSIAHMLKLLLPDKSLLKERKRNIMFMIFNGESYDYIGSQRFVYDLENMTFPYPYTHTKPISFADIEFVMDLGTFDNIESIHLHSIAGFPQAKLLLNKLQYYANRTEYDFNIRFEENVGYKMPPTSAQSFLRRNLSFPVCVLNSPPTNRYYHSIYDDSENVKFNYANTSLDYTQLMPLEEAFQYVDANSIQMKIRNVSSVIAMALYEMLTLEEYTSKNLANPLLIDEFLYCFLTAADCNLFRAASKPNSFPRLNMPPSRYISVLGSPQDAFAWSYRLIAYLLSQHLPNVTEDECLYLPRHWFAGYHGNGECRYTTHNYSIALSPAFIIEDYDWRSGEYSTWTESTWSPFSARMFLRPSRLHEILTLCTGIVVMVISFCLIYVINTRSEILFEDTGPVITNDALGSSTAC